jgi:N-methylhydantoinase B/oxoprolinase/acetone carboxylase alpha subunit
MWRTFGAFGVSLSYRETLVIRGSTYLLALVNYGVGQGGIVYFVHRERGVALARAVGITLLIMGINLVTLVLLADLGALLSHDPGEKARLLRTILLNSRTPQERIGDLKAQLAANRAGGQRLTEIHAQYGPDLLGESMREILDYTERRTRQGIAAMPDGVYESEGFCDDDGLTDRPVRIRVAVTVRGDRIALDFSGTDSQIQGAKNVPTVSLLATVYYVLKAVIDPDIPPNAGYYRAITVHVPPGTVLNPLPPAAVAARFTTCQKVADVILSAFARSVPERVVAHCHGGTLAIYSGTNPRTDVLVVWFAMPSIPSLVDRAPLPPA